MRVRFFGPLGRVTGSCAMLWDEPLGVRVLVDCGMQQGEGDERANSAPFPFEPASIGKVILTHAHIDHAGLLPKLYREGFTGEVVCTPETAALAELLLTDGAGITGLYTLADVERIRFNTRPRAFGDYFPLARDVFCQFFRTAHILGAVSARISWGPRGPEQRSIVFSGDLGPAERDKEASFLLKHRMAPPPSNYAVVESTYGARATPVDEAGRDRVADLRTAVLAGVERGGPVLIPAFATDRFQNLLLDLTYVWNTEPRLSSVPLYAQSPLAEKICGVYASFVASKDVARGKVSSRWLSKSGFRRTELSPDNVEDERSLEQAIECVLGKPAPRVSPVPTLRRVHQWIRHPADSGGACVVLTTSGMCEGGPIVAYLPRYLRDPRATILTTGYASPSSVAGELLRLGSVPTQQRGRLEGKITLDRDQTVACADVQATVQALHGYSAHADQAALLRWLMYEHAGERHLAAPTVFIQHGNNGAREALASALVERESRVTVVRPDEASCEYDLDGEPLGEVRSAGATDDHALHEELRQLRLRVAGLEHELVALRSCE